MPPPLWFTAIIDTLLIFGTPFLVGFVVDIVRLRAQRLPDHRIVAVERLALQAAKSIAPMTSLDARRGAADIVLLELCKEYRVVVPSKEARKHVLNSAFFDIGG